MPIINIRKRELMCKIVYAGPALGGKTTSIKSIHRFIPDEERTELSLIHTEGDQTLFFDYFSMDLEDIAGFKTKFMVYGVPGQPFYRTTRKTVLNGVDGLVFVADSDASRIEDNLESLEDMHTLLKEYGYKSEEIPLVIQYNKRDLFYRSSVEELDALLNHRGSRVFETVAIKNKGTREAFQRICSEVIQKLRQKMEKDYGWSG